MKPFTARVPSLDEGRRLCDVLANYDDFQFKHNVKPDYCNAGGVQLRHPIGTDGEWWDVPDDDDELADILSACEAKTELARP